MRWVSTHCDAIKNDSSLSPGRKIIDIEKTLLINISNRVDQLQKNFTLNFWALFRSGSKIWKERMKEWKKKVVRQTSPGGARRIRFYNYFFNWMRFFYLQFNNTYSIIVITIINIIIIIRGKRKDQKGKNNWFPWALRDDVCCVRVFMGNYTEWQKWFVFAVRERINL